MPYISLDNRIKIHYQTMGSGDPHIVMIHGIASSLAFWYLDIFAMLANEFRVTIYDLRGHGYSDVTESGYTSDSMAGDLKGLIQALDIERPHLVGHSFGGVIALYYTMLYPENVSKLVVADTGIPAVQYPQEDKPFWRSWIDLLRHSGISTQEDSIDDIDYLLQQTRIASARCEISPGVGWPLSFERLCERLADLARETSMPRDFCSATGLTLEKLRELSSPVLAIYGEHSPSMATCQYLSENLPNCRTIVIPAVGHFHPLECPQIFVENVRAFLKEQA